MRGTARSYRLWVGDCKFPHCPFRVASTLTPVANEPMKLKSGELSIWVRLVTATVKRTIADAKQQLRDTNQSITAFLAAARPDPLTTDELVNELRPVTRMRP
jgi:hypothetical protein